MRISGIIFVGFAFILVLFSITTYVNYRQSREVKEDADWVTNSQLIIRQTSRFQRNIVEMQSNLRGLMLTGEPIFLEPYQAAVRENHELIRELKSLIPDTSFRQKELLQIQQLYVRWQDEFANPLIEARQGSIFSDSADIHFNRLYASQLQKETEQNLSNRIREEFKSFNNYEYDLRAQRRKNLDESVADTRRVSIALTSSSILIGLVIAFYIAYLISKRIGHMVNLADRLAKGNFGSLIEDKSRDELSHLSKSLNSMARTLSENISALQRKNQELDRFAYVVSHDLKAPLRGIENTLQWIEEDFDQELPARLKEYHQMMKGRAQRMENLINGILELSRIGKEKKSVEKVSTKRMAREIVEMLAPDAGLQIHLQPNLPSILTERIPLQQVLANLIGNAMKYHHRKDGHIYVRYRDMGPFHEFSVIDDGPGIEPKYHEKIFIVFQTLQERDAFESTGVGLAIVKKILEDRQCSIRVVSDVGKGATFTFTWPKAGRNGENAEQDSEEAAEAAGFLPNRNR